jgi:hypothetical protein
MKNVHMELETQVSHLSVQTKRESFFEPALIRPKTSKTPEYSIDEQM